MNGVQVPGPSSPHASPPLEEEAVAKETAKMLKPGKKIVMENAIKR